MMTLKEWKKELDNLIASHPEVLDLSVIYSVDDEGNDYKTVEYSPCTGILKLDPAGNFQGLYLDSEVTKDEISRCNAVCLN